MRKIISPFPIPGTNYILPAGDFLMCAPGVSAIDPDHWENPLEFYPERWQYRRPDEESEEKIDFGYGLVSKGGNSPYLPFGAGRHRCIGEQFANIQLGTILSVFVREMKWTANKDVPKPDYTVCLDCVNELICRVWLLCLRIQRSMNGRGESKINRGLNLDCHSSRINN